MASVFTRTRFAYPPSSRGTVADDYHGTPVADPYRWLEDLDSPQTREWIEAQSALTESVLQAVPGRDVICERITAVFDYERFGIPSRVGANYVFSKNSGLQNQSVLYIAPAIDAPARIVLDPNTLSEDGTVALAGGAFSDDGAFFAYATSASGSDWMTWRVRDVASGQDLDDEIRWSKFSGASWRRNGSGFYYSRYAEPASETQFKDANFDHKLYFHAIGTPQSDDVLVYERLDHPDWTLSAQVSEDDRWLVLDAYHGTDPHNRVFLLDLLEPSATVVDLLPDGDAQYSFLGNDGPRFYFSTTNAAPRGRIVALLQSKRTPLEIVAQSDDTLQGASMHGDRFICEYLHDAHSLIRVHGMTGSLQNEVTLPGIGTAGGFGGKRRHAETFFSFTSYTTPASIYRYDVASATTTPVFSPSVDFDPADFVSEQVFYASKDGTRIPMIVTAKRGAPRDGSVPTILYGYGGFDVSLTPGFSPSTLVWMEMGGAFAVANLRGGGEYGEAWHLAGTKAQKQNVFDDFIAAAEYLIAEHYTSSSRLAIYGGSNGGLLVGAAMTQRPELFGAAVPSVGVMDMLRFQKFTIGWAWISDYGSSDNADEFPYLYAYSPLHRIRAGVAYPATMITTADHDDRVYPAHSFKFAAALQAAQGGPAPVLIRIESKAGHGAGKPTSKVIEEAADRWAFLVDALNFTPNGDTR